MSDPRFIEAELAADKPSAWTTEFHKAVNRNFERLIRNRIHNGQSVACLVDGGRFDYGRTGGERAMNGAKRGRKQ